MKIATYNVNGINGRLPVLLRWLNEDAPDVVCLQELKSPNDRFPRSELERAGYGAVWHGQKSWNGVAILAKGLVPLLTRRGLPADPDDTHSRYIEAAVDGLLIGCLYLPNGNPAPGPKYDTRLLSHEQDKQDDDRQGNAQEPEKNTATHLKSPSCRERVVRVKTTTSATIRCSMP